MAGARLKSLCVSRGSAEGVGSKGPGLGGPDHLARCSPVVLPLSRQTRLARLHKHATYRQGPQQLVLPLWTGRDAPDLATQLADLLLDLVPVPTPDRVADADPAESPGGPVAS